MLQVVFFTCANGAYESFVPLYACSALYHVDDSVVEVGVENEAEFSCDHRGALTVLASHFPARLHIRAASFSGILANTVRFVTVPETVARYTYIGDVDVLVLDENVVQHHVAAMQATGLPYSNTVRPKSPSRLTGLHFTETKAQYPLPDLSDLDLRRMNDEEVLREIVMRKGMAILDQSLWRPVHGIHMSPHRPAVWAGEMRKDGRRMPDWGIRPWREQYAAFADSPVFRELRSHLVGLARSSIDTIDSFYSAGCVGS